MCSPQLTTVPYLPHLPRSFPFLQSSLALIIPDKHNDYWAQNGYEVRDGTFFPGFETGWHDAVEVLSTGNQIPGDLDDWAKKRAQEKGQPEGTWEWEHGHKQGVKAAEQAGGA